MSIDPSQPPSAPPAPRVTGQYQHTYEEFAEAIAAIQKQTDQAAIRHAHAAAASSDGSC
jgi:hypothetical protein